MRIKTYVEYKSVVDVFYVAFSGGKDSVVALDLVQRALPHNSFKVLFGDTGMEFPDTYDVVNKTKEYCEGQEIEFLRAKSKLAPQQTWKVFGPPAVTIRWCCSVHKTTPQITLLRDILDKRDFTGMAFTGIRGDESASRNEYDGISYGGKHTGQYSCHPILEWNTAELFLYIYQNNLILNEAYKKGNTRAGCLVCPMSQGKHDFMKHQSYPDETSAYIECIASTSGKKHYSPNELTHFVESGYWRTRKSGRELNFGQDLHTFELVDGKNVITIFNKNIRWKEWVKTIGPLTLFDDNRYCIEYENHQYFFRIKDMPDGGEQFIFQSFGNGKDDVKFISLFKSSIIKSVYCINCGYCAAECKKGCIDMANGLKISSDCEHCHSCHDIYSHCLRYNSIKNRIGAKSMTGLDRYYSFGVKENWLRVYFDYEGSANFWNTDGDGEIPNKKKDAFLNFVKDAGMVYEDKTLKGKESKYIRFKPNSLATSGISGHVVVLTYQCKNYLKFSDPRIVESGRVVIVDGASDTTPGICLVNPSISAAFAGCYSGLQKIGAIVENCPQNTAYISTMALKDSFPESIYHISQLNNGYDILARNDPRTKSVPNSFGTPEQWNYALQKMGQNGNWSQLIEGEFGSELNLCHAIASYQKYDDNKKWLYFIALSISGAKENEYLQMVIDSVSTEKELIKTIFRLILTIDKSNAKFDPLYRQRKDLLGELKDCLSEIAEYCKVLATKGENAIYYLTDLTILEKERVIAWLNVYGQKYDTLKLISVLKKVFPDLASYLTKFRFKNKLLDDYFDAYKYQKVVNHILPSFETVVDEQATKMDFVTALKPRAAIVEKLDVTNSRAFFLDALGVEYLGFIQEKCSEYGLSVDVSCGRCELPSITSQNKEFVATLQSKGCVIADIKDLDDIKHHGEDSFDYEKEKNPIYLIRELEIIDELLKKIQASIFNGSYEKAIIISDHGASRLAVLHETENIWSMATSGEHSGRCCPVNELNSKPNAAIEENGFWVLANYDRFKGGRKANVEVHGGASLEEVAVPIIEITRKQTNIEAFILDSSRVITLAAKEHAALRIYVGVKSNSIGIMLNGQYYDALATSEPYIYSVDLADYTRKGTYTFEILNGNDILASGQKFEIKKMGMSENAGLFDF